VFSILNPVKDPALSFFYRPIRLLDMFGKLFENMLLTGILSEISGRCFLRNEKFGFRPKLVLHYN